MIKIAVIPPIPVPEEELARRKKQYEKYAGKDTSVEVRLLKGGPPLTDSEYELLWAKGYMVREAEKAEAEGADAVVIDCTTDPGITEMRQSLDIPVTGALESSVMLALQTGRTFSVLALDEIWAGMITRKIEEYKLDRRFVSAEAVGTHVYNPSRGREMNDDEQAVFSDLLLKAGKRALDKGADSVILGSTTIIGERRNLEDRLGIPVIAPGPAALKTAELMLALRLYASRKAYPGVDRYTE